MSDYDDLDPLVDTDPIALGRRCRQAEAKVARHEETLHWVKAIWAGREVPNFIPGYVTERLEELR